MEISTTYQITYVGEERKSEKNVQTQFVYETVVY